MKAPKRAIKPEKEESASLQLQMPKLSYKDKVANFINTTVASTLVDEMDAISRSLVCGRYVRVAVVDLKENVKTSSNEMFIANKIKYVLSTYLQSANAYESGLIYVEDYDKADYTIGVISHDTSPNEIYHLQRASEVSHLVCAVASHRFEDISLPVLKSGTLILPPNKMAISKSKIKLTLRQPNVRIEYVNLANLINLNRSATAHKTMTVEFSQVMADRGYYPLLIASLPGNYSMLKIKAKSKRETMEINQSMGYLKPMLELSSLSNTIVVNHLSSYETRSIRSIALNSFWRVLGKIEDHWVVR